MKSRYIYLYASLLMMLLIGACSKEDKPTIGLSQDAIVDVPSEGASYDIEVTTEGRWAVQGEPQEWLRLVQHSKDGKKYLHIEVESNIGEASRQATIELLSQYNARKISVQQVGKPAGQELKYRLPIVFHVFYSDATDKTQNIPTESINQVLAEVNKIYEKNGINLEFVAATVDPSGSMMPEPGIDRVKWVSSTLDPIAVMDEEDSEYLHLMWDPNRYVNVMLYNFTIENILGIAAFPLVPEQYPLEGMDKVPYTRLAISDLDKVRGVSVNSAWFQDLEGDSNPFRGFVDDELIKRQVSIATTVAHELGHYLGLRHVFAEGPMGSCVDTDFCHDTPSYSKRGNGGYDELLGMMMSEAMYNPNFRNDYKPEDLFKRTACDGSEFVSRNIMDYAYSHMDTFSPDQKSRIRHTLHYSPFIPGPKLSVTSTLRHTVPLAPVSVPHKIVICQVDKSWQIAK